MSLFKDERYSERITLEEAKQYAPYFGYELLETCQECEWYLVKDGAGTVLSMVFECESKREEAERRRRAREMGEHILIYGHECADKHCYVIKEITNNSAKRVDL